VAVSVIRNTTVTIANGASQSSEIALGENSLVAIIIPAGWTAADITALGSADGDTYYDLYDTDGNEVTVQADESRSIVLDPAEWTGLKFIKLRSGTTALAVNQGAARTLTVLYRFFE
jgi:hypothetical protein